MVIYVKQIVSYLEYLKNNYGWQITIHEFSCITGRYTAYFQPYLVHGNAFCIHVKNTAEVWDRCVERQTRVLKNLNAPIFFGMCHCGVEEYILPIKYKAENIGFISISGYRKNTDIALQKIAHVVEKYQLNLDEFKRSYFENLTPNIPEIDFVYTLMAPVVMMLEYLYIKQIEIYKYSLMTDRDDSFILSKVLQYLKRFYRERISLQDLCALCNCSCSYMSHMFKKQTGKSINQYINELRISEAKILLANTRLSITNVALQTGFSSSNYFANVFREHCCCSPTEYRKKYYVK